MGCLQGAIATRANEIYDKLTVVEKQAVQRIFLQLATRVEQGDDRRRRASFVDVDASSIQVLERVTDARLLVTSAASGTGMRTIELYDEALISNWDKFRAWLDQDREFLLWRKRLAGFVDVWVRSGRKETGLLSGAFLTEAETWLNKRSDRLTTEEREYIRASAACLKREHDRMNHRKRAVVAVIAGLGLMALLFGIYSQRERRHAEKQAEHSLALQLSAQSGQMTSTRIADALLLGAAAVNSHATYESKDNLFRLLSSIPFDWFPVGTQRRGAGS